MSEAIAIIQADMRQFFRAGFSIRQYGADHVISALRAADFDMRTLPPFITATGLLRSALISNLRKALKQ